MSRKVKIFSDTDKGCIFFEGSTVNPKFIGTIIASVHPTRADRIIIKRTDRFQNDNISFRVLFGKMHMNRVQNRDGENLVQDLGFTHQEVVDYINAQANDFQDSSSVRPGLDAHPNFDLDPTSTSVIIDNGDHFGVNTIKAVLGPDNLVDIVSSDFSNNNITYYEDCPPENLQIKGSFIGGGPNDVVNALNELFTVGAFQSVVISDPFSTVVADVNGVDAGYTLEGADAIDPEGDDIFTYDGVGYANYAGLKSVATIDQVGEYYTFDIRGEGTIGFGLVHSDASFAAGKFSGNSNYADPDSFAAVNSAHYGFQFSHWFHGTPNGSWTNYGANTGYSMRAGWSNFNGTTEQADWLAGNPIKVRCGIDANGFISIETLRDGSNWVVHSRSSYPVPEGGEYHLGIKSQSTAARVYSAPKVHLQVPEAPTLQFRYVESPDNSFDYPLFASAEEANYVDEENGGSGTSHQHVYVDDPTGTSWFMPDTGATMAGASAPDGTETFDGNLINWTEITTLSDSQLTPSAFSGSDYNLDEEESVNIQTQPQDTAYVTTFAGLPAGLSDAGGGMIQGTTQHVFGDQTYPVTVTRTNGHGSSVGSFNLVIVDNVAQNAIPGYTIHGNNPITESPDTVHHYSGPVNLDLNQLLFPGTELIWTQQNGSPVGGPGQYLQIGIADPGVDKATTVLGNQTTDWQLKATIWTGTLNHMHARGWDNNGTQNLGNNDNIEWKLSFPSDNGVIELYRDGVLVCTSTDNYSGNQTVTVGVPGTYSTTTRMPSVTRADVAFAGDPPAGFTLLDGAMDTAALLGGDPDDGVVALDLVLESGKRMIVPKTWVETNVLPHTTDSLEKAYIGVPATDANWSSVDLHLDFDAVMRWEGQSSDAHKSTIADGSDNVANHSSNVGSSTNAYWNYAIEWDGTDLVVLRDADLAKFSTEHDCTQFTHYARYENYTDRAGDLPLVMATKDGGTVSLSVSGITQIDIPSAPAVNQTPWTKAVDFSGGAERMAQEGGGNAARNPLRQVGTSAIGMPVSGTVSTDGNARPFATGIVFRHDGNGSDQYIWGQVEGSGSGDDNIALKVDASNNLLFKWGRGTDKSVKDIGTVTPNTWYGVYVDFNGFVATSPTVSEMADAFRIRIVELDTGSVGSVMGDWDLAARNNRTVGGNFFVGGRDAGKSFHGKVASMVVTALKAGDTLPDNAEIAMMVRDPEQWLVDYKIGNSYRATGTNFNNANFQLNDIGAARNTQVWLMGDGTSDAYAVIRNQVHPSDQNETAIRMTSMLSNDIQSVTVPGLTS